MELIIVNDPTKPILPNVVTAYLRGLVDREICFNYIYIPRFKEITITIHNSFGVNMPFTAGRVLNDPALIAAVEAWVPSVYTFPTDFPPDA